MIRRWRHVRRNVVDQRTADDCCALLARRFGGDVQLAAYVSLAQSRNVPTLDVLRAAVDDRLADIVGRSA